MVAKALTTKRLEARHFVALFLLVFAGGCGTAGKNLPPLQTPTNPAVEPARDANDSCYLPDGTSQISLSRSEIHEVVSDHMNDVKRCFRRGRRVDRELCGRIDVQVVIGNTGSVRLSTVAQSSLEHPETEKCIANAFKDWQFPAPKCGGLVIFNYPLELHPNPPINDAQTLASAL